MIKSLRNVDLSEYLREWLASAPKVKGNLKLEVDPQSFLQDAMTLRELGPTKKPAVMG